MALRGHRLAGYLTTRRRDGSDTLGAKNLFTVIAGFHGARQSYGLIHVSVELRRSRESVLLVGTRIGDHVLIGLACFREATGNAHSSGLSRIRSAGLAMGCSLRGSARSRAGLLGIGSETEAQDEERYCGQEWSFHEEHLTRI